MTAAWMGGCQALVGIAEAVIAGTVVAALARRRMPAGGAETDGRSVGLVPVLALAVIASVLRAADTAAAH